MRWKCLFIMAGACLVAAPGRARVANPSVNVPATPPPTAIALVDAFPGISFDAPVCLTSPPGDASRLFVGEQSGIIQAIANVASPAKTTFFDLAATVSLRANEEFDYGGEAGLLGLAFHPSFASNRQFFVFYSVRKRTSATAAWRSYQRVSRFTTQAANPAAADPASELILIDQLDDASNHNGGDLHFGPDGYLYISVGDEGYADDSLDNSQTIIKDFHSGILRIDVDKKPGNVAPTAHAALPDLTRFSIPIDNPFVHTSVGGTWDGRWNGTLLSSTNRKKVRREFYATGLRNPWRFSFDPATGQLWCADVGQNAWEEIDLIVKGGNYGWAYREGNHNGAKSGAAPANFDTLYHRPPLYEYPHGGGNFGGYSVTGGRVYRGTRVPSLSGRYVFADYVSGHVWSMATSGASVERITGEGGVSAFGTDPSNQDLLLADHDDGRILRLVSGTPSGSFPATLSATGLFANLATLAPAAGLVPYSVNLPFWSDHALKQRWFIIPDGTSRFTPATDAPWTLPAGTIWVKHFELETTRGNPTTRKRIETRLLVKNSSGAYGVSYRWNEAGTDATLAADAGEDLAIPVTEGTTSLTQNWRIPSRAECMVCHNPKAGHALSFNTRQLNLDGSGELAGNQLSALHQNGYLTANPGSPHLLPRHLRPDESQWSIEARVRSYLAVNCAYCHQQDGSWDGRPELTLAQTGLVNGIATNNGGDPLKRLLVPGDPARSILLHRVAGSGGFNRMPPIGGNLVDSSAVALLTTWIQGELANRLTYDEWRTTRLPTGPEGEPAADADRDGSSNHDEFLAGTDPNKGASAFRPRLSGQPPTLRFEVPANRSFRIETSSSLGGWTPWDIPGNQGLPVAGGTFEFAVPITGARRFFRVELREN
jgi:uncharacterized repeat protein (TIGR03806 family)